MESRQDIQGLFSSGTSIQGLFSSGALTIPLFALAASFLLFRDPLFNLLEGGLKIKMYTANYK